MLHAALRARRLESDYGGSAPPLDLGIRRLGERIAVAQPIDPAFGPRTQHRVEQQTFGPAYEGRWRDLGEFSLGVQRTDYQKRVAPAGLPATTTQDAPWLVNGLAASRHPRSTWWPAQC